MNKNFKIAILGGTGKSGKYLVKELLHQNYQIKLLLRNPENLQAQGPAIEVVQGDARNYESVALLVQGSDAVISMLGQPKGEPTIFSEATRNVIRAMVHYNVNRYIVTTGLNVDTPLDKKGDQTKGATEWMRTNYPKTTYDKQVEYDLLVKSRVNWTLVRLPMIEQTDQRLKTSISLENCEGNKISSADLAHFVIEQLSTDAYVRQAPFISNI